MRRNLARVVATWLGLLVSAAGAQAPPMDNKPDPMKAPDPAKAKITLDKIKLPPGGILVVVQEIKEALSPLVKMIVMTPEKYKELKDRLDQLEKQLKSDKKTAHSCKLSGRLEGDYIQLQADFAFTTEQPRTSVALGLQGAYLTDVGDLDRQLPVLDVGDEGLSVRVEKEGTHHLTLQCKLPVGLKRAGPTGGSAERGFDLGLPGAAVTTLSLELPAGVKEIRWNDSLEKNRVQNRWEIALGNIKKLNFSWKEPVALPGSGPLLTADYQITVKIDEGNVVITGDITLEDLRGKTEDWQLLLPPNARVEVKTPGGIAPKLFEPDGKNPFHLLRLGEPSFERILVNVQVRQPRPPQGIRLAIGPFAVQGAYRQQGTIAVHATADNLRGQRLVFHRFGDIYQRDLTKIAAADLVALFQFWNLPGPAKNPKAPMSPVPLELELKTDKGQLEATGDHLLYVRPAARGWLIDGTFRYQVKAKQSRIAFLDVQLPGTRSLRLGWLGASTFSPFPATLAWPSLPLLFPRQAPLAFPLEFTCEDDGAGQKLSPPDALRRARIKWNRPPTKDDFQVVLNGKYFVPQGQDRVRVELPRLLDLLDRGAKTTSKVDNQLEILLGSPGAETPAPEKHQVQTAWDLTPDFLEIAWKPNRPEFPIVGLSDVVLHHRTAQVKHQLSFIVPPPSVQMGLPPNGQLRFRVPSAIRSIGITGGRLVIHEPDRESAWIIPDAKPGEAGEAKAEIVFDYDFALPRKDDAEADKNIAQLIQVPLPWPEGATRHDAKVRIWSEAGTAPKLVDLPGQADSWKDRGIEKIPGYDAYPALVLQGFGLDLPLTLRLLDNPQARLAALVCDRCLVQATIDEEGNHSYRVRYFIQKLNARQLDLEFPIPAANCVQAVLLDQKKIDNWEPFWNIARIPIEPKLFRQPVILEIKYNLPVSFTEGKRFWQTTLFPPLFRTEVLLGKVRWQLNLPPTWVSLVPGTAAEYRWGLQGWLLGPESAVTSADLENWLTNREGAEPPDQVSLAFLCSGQDNIQLLHLPRQLYLLVCSGLFLAVGLVLFVAPLARALFWFLLIALGLAVLVAGLLWPSWVPILFFGCQPGIVVLLFLVAFQWMLQESYRRQLVFMPGFARLKTNSSLIRAGGSGNRPREAPTIDVPAPAPGATSGPPLNPRSSKGS